MDASTGMRGVTCWNERVNNLRSWHRTTVPPPFGTAKRAIARAPRIPAPLLMFWIVTWQSLTLSLSNPCFYKAVICHDVHAQFGTRYYYQWFPEMHEDYAFLLLPSTFCYGLGRCEDQYSFNFYVYFICSGWSRKRLALFQCWLTDVEPTLSQHLVEVYFLLGYDIFFGKNFRGLFCSKQFIAGYVNEVFL